MFTAGAESVEKTQMKIEQILKLHREGLSAQAIADSMDWDLSQVKPVLMGNDEALTSELAKLLEQAKDLRCAYSRRLAYQPLMGPDGIIYEKRVLEEWMLTNDTWPKSNRPLRAPLAEVDKDVKEQVKQFSLRALEVVQNGNGRSAHRETAIPLAAECLGVLNVDSNLHEFLGVLLNCSREEQEAILGSFKLFRPSLLRKLLLSVAAMPNQCGLTLMLAEVLEEAQLKSKKVKAKAFINTLKRTWREKTHSQLSAFMIVVLGRLYAKINETEQAEDCLHEAKFAQQPAETDLSEFHEGLGDLHFDLTHYELAKVCYKEAINKSTDPQTYGRAHKRIEHIQELEHREQARDCRAKGESQLADLYEQASSHHASTEQRATIYNSLGTLYEKNGDYPRAEEYLQKCLSIREDVLPANHPDMATIYNSLGTLYDSKGDYPRAEENLQKCLTIREDVLPANHPDMATIYNSLGTLYDSKGDFPRAEEYLQKCLSIRQNVLPASHSDMATIYHSLGLLYYSKGDYPRAEEYLQKSLGIREDVLPASHSDLATSYNSLGVLYCSKGDYPRSEEYYLKCLVIRQDVLPANHHNLTSIYNNLGALYASKGDYPRAEEYYLKCLGIWQHVLPANHPDLAAIYNNLGSLYDSKGDSTRAEEYYLKCLGIWQDVLPANHPNLAMIYNKLGTLYRRKGDNTRAEEYFRRSK
jgi:tetratricopeptide (TPR) repeat protein